jgi:hypothetical protein
MATAAVAAQVSQQAIHPSVPQQAWNQVLPGHGTSQPVPLPYCMGCSNSNTCSHPSKTQTSLKPLVWTPSKRVTTGTVMLQRQAHRTQASQPGLEAMGRSLKGNDRQRHKHAVSAHACVAAGQQTVLHPRNTGAVCLGGLHFPWRAQ